MSVCRTCPAQITWARTEKGKRIPLDVGRVPDGNITVDAEGVAHYVTPGTGDRVSHFATCPNAKEHRR